MAHYVLNRSPTKKPTSTLDTILDSAESLWQAMQHKFEDNRNSTRQKKNLTTGYY